MLVLVAVVVCIVGCSDGRKVFKSDMGYRLSYDPQFEVIDLEDNDLTLAYKPSEYPDFTPLMMINSNLLDKKQDEKEVFQKIVTGLEESGVNDMPQPKVIEAPGADLYHVTWPIEDDGKQRLSRVYGIYEPTSGLQVRMVVVVAAKDEALLDKFTPVAESAELPQKIEFSL